jgi:hypothetical protein
MRNTTPPLTRHCTKIRGKGPERGKRRGVDGEPSDRPRSFELVHGAVELTLVGFAVGEEAIDKLRDLQWLAVGEFAGFAAVLIQDGGFGVLEDGIAGGVSGLDLLLDFGGEAVGSVLGLSPAAGQAELVADGAVGDDALAAGIGRKLRHQSPAAFFGGFGTAETV